MSTPINEIWLAVAGHLERLDLDEETNLLPTFQANDRTKPESIQSEYGPEFSVPGTTGNHRRLRHAAASQPTTGSAYVRVPAVLTSGGVETMPLALLYLKGYREGRYYLQLAGGNRRLIEALGEKMLSDLDFSRFNHDWLPAPILARLPYAYWATNGWGYEIYDRGKPVDFENLDPYTCYPSVAGWLIWQQILTDAGFTADSLMGEPLFAQLSVPTANPYVYPTKFRDARALQSGLLVSSSLSTNPLEKTAEFAPEKLHFSYTSLPPYRTPTEGASYVSEAYLVDTLGYYNLSASVLLNYGCDGNQLGNVSCKVALYVNGAPVYSGPNQIGQDEHPRINGYKEETFTPSLTHYLLHPGDTVELFWQGDEWDTQVNFPVPGSFPPVDPRWRVANGNRVDVGIPGMRLYTKATLSVELLEEFPHGGLIKLNEWLPQEMRQLDFVKTIMQLLGLTIEADDYRPHLHLAPGTRLLQNTYQAKDWTRKRDAFAQPGRLPERDLSFAFGDYAQRNYLKWTADEDVTEGYGDGEIPVANENLATEYDLATLPFAATEPSTAVAGLLRIRNFKIQDVTTTPITYATLTAKPRLVLRTSEPVLNGHLDNEGVLQAFTTTVSYFAGLPLSLLLNSTVLTDYWQDLKAMLDESRYLVERYRLTEQDIAELDYTIPIWDAVLGDYFAVSQVVEYSPDRPTETHLVRLNAAHLPPPVVPGGSREWYAAEFFTSEFY